MAAVSSSHDPPPTVGRRISRLWALAVTAIAIALITAGVLLYVFRTLSRAPEAIARGGRATLDRMVDVASAFRAGTVTTSFVSYAAEVSGMSRLQFASLRQIEQFDRTDQASLLWGTLQLPDLVVRATAPVEYTYYLDLEGPWRFTLEGRRIVAHTPPIEWNRPAVDLARLDYEVRSGSLFRDEGLALDRLRRAIGAMAEARAGENVELVREIGRRQVEQFIRTWLLNRFEDADLFQVEVVFPAAPDLELPGRELPAGPPGGQR